MATDLKQQQTYDISLSQDLFVDPTFEKVKKFDGYFPVKHLTIKDSKFDKLSTSSCKLLVRLLSLCYQHSSMNIQVNVHDLPTFRRVNVQDLFSELNDFGYLAHTERKKELKEIKEKKERTGLDPAIELFEESNIQEFVNFWNSFSELPTCIKVSSSRKDKIHKRLNEPLFDYKKAIPMIIESDFLSGRSGAWKATLDWFIENDKNYVKVLEGNYTNKKNNNSFEANLKAQAERLKDCI